MKFNTFLPIVIAVLLLGCSTGALGSDSLNILADYAAYQNPADGSAFVEFYYSLYRSELGFLSADTLERQYAGVFVGVRISDAEGNPVDSVSTYILPSAPRDINPAADKKIRYFDVLMARLVPGDYNAYLTAIDDVTKKTGHAMLEFSVPQYDSNQFASSDLQLAYDLKVLQSEEKSAVNPRLVKEGRQVIPNPTGIYQRSLDSLLYVYSELYGFDTENTEKNAFALRYQIKDPIGTLISEHGPLRYEKPGKTAVMSNSIDISDLEPGQYRLVFQAIDLDSRRQAMAVKEFMIIDAETGERPLDSSDIKVMLDIAWYQLTEAEKIQVPGLSLNGQRNFLNQFWRERDPDPTTPENPVYEETVRRFMYANKMFPAHLGKQGWQTDRGRVYMTYGPCNEETELPMPGESDALLVWRYYGLEKGVIFIFVNDEKTWTDDYRLVHSDHSREITNEYWVSVLEDISPADSWRSSNFESSEPYNSGDD